MNRQAHLGRLIVIAMTTAGLFLITNVQAFAQKTDYKAGEKIEYFDHYTDKWEIGVFVEKSYDGSQAVIRTKPSQYFPQGEEKALAWNQIRPLQTQPENNQAVENQTQPVPSRESISDQKTKTTGEGLMSQADIVNFLKTNLGANPFDNPKREEIKSQLAEEIKRRGLDFHFQSLSDFFNQLANYGAITTDITFPLKDNYGAPTKQSWLVGAWRLDKIGATTDYEKDGYIYRKEASAAANIGKLTINADGTYVWQTNAPIATFRGKWRKATAEEMRTQGGDGVVLLKAKNEWDWIVMQNRAWTKQGDLIWVSDLSTRQVREIGSRGGR